MHLKKYSTSYDRELPVCVEKVNMTMGSGVEVTLSGETGTLHQQITIKRFRFLKYKVRKCRGQANVC